MAMARLLLAAALAAIALAKLASSSPIVITDGDHEQTDRYKTTGGRGVVACEVGYCSDIGADMLARGGSAADAIIAAGFCVGSVSAFHSGLAGGGFALIRSRVDEHKTHPHKVEFVDFRETAPAAANETMYSANANKNASTIGGLAVGVPGEVRYWEYLHKKHGRLSWSELIEPSVKLNRQGFPVVNQLAIAIDQYKDQFICNDPLFKEVYCANGTAAGEGDIIKRTRLADTLETIASQGADAFYKGPIAERTVKAAQDAGGILTLDDLANYSVVTREPLSIDWHGKYRVWGSSAPSSGAVVLSALKTASTYSDAELDAGGVNLTTHRLIEATKFAYGERENYGDPNFVTNVSSLEAQALSEGDTKKKRSLIKDNTTLPLHSYDTSSYTNVEEHGTSALSAMDPFGLAISMTTTINLLWGSQVMTPDGFILNDEMDDFSSPGAANSYGYQPNPANFIRPGKRPLSSISPTIIEDYKTGKASHSVASAGGSRIITANIQINFQALRGVDLQEAIAAPRWHDQLQPPTTVFEWADSTSPPIPGWKGYDNSTVAFLASLGHNVSFVQPNQATAQGTYRGLDSHGVVAHEFKGASEIRQLSAKSAAL